MRYHKNPLVWRSAKFPESIDETWYNVIGAFNPENPETGGVSLRCFSLYLTRSKSNVDSTVSPSERFQIGVRADVFSKYVLTQLVIPRPVQLHFQNSGWNLCGGINHWNKSKGRQGGKSLGFWIGGLSDTFFICWIFWDPRSGKKLGEVQIKRNFIAAHTLWLKTKTEKKMSTEIFMW